MDFQVPKRPFYYLPIELNLFTWYPLFPLCFIIPFFFNLSNFHVFLTITICIYLCFAEKILFHFLPLVSSVIRLEYQTRQAPFLEG